MAFHQIRGTKRDVRPRFMRATRAIFTILTEYVYFIQVASSKENKPAISASFAMLHRHTVSKEFFAIHLINSIITVSVVLKVLN